MEKIKKEYRLTEEEMEKYREKIKEEEIMKKMRKVMEREREKTERKELKEKEESGMKEKEYMEEMIEEKEGGKVKLSSVYEKYYKWLMKDEEIPEEKKADKRDTTRYLRNYIKKMKYSIVQGKINGKNSKCIKNMEWKELKET